MNPNVLFYSLAAVAVVMSLLTSSVGTLIIVLVLALLWKRH